MTSKICIGPHTLEKMGNIFLFTMNNGQNTFNYTSLGHYNQMLDIVEREKTDHTALVVVGSDKFWCTGLDLPWLKQQQSNIILDVVHKFQLFLARYQKIGVMTIAAVNGHCYGGGALWSLVHDYRIMNPDRGFWCVPAINIGFKLTSGMMAIFSNKLGPSTTVRDAVLTGKRFTAQDAFEFKIVDEVIEKDKVIERGMKVAKELSAKHGPTLAIMKAEQNAEILSLLSLPITGDISTIFPNL